ncbi:hypothetical protein HUJ04_004060 [Dendroctonus ponderosae]
MAAKKTDGDQDGKAADKKQALDVKFQSKDDPADPDEAVDASSFTGLYRFATQPQKYVIVIGAIIALISGALQPLNNLLFGDLTQTIIEYSQACFIPSSTECGAAGDNLLAGIKHFALWNSLNGVAIMITAYLATEAFSYNAIKQVFKVRSLYLQRLLNKDIPWFDVHNSGDFSSRMADDLSKFEDGIGEKVPLFLTLQGSFISAITLALVKGWELALICLISLPVSLIAVGLIAFLNHSLLCEEGLKVCDFSRYGNKEATEQDIVQAAKRANAHRFIKGLPEGYHTLVGERGAQLSGGQKQRIAIARALVRNPAILLLDEATSALDTNSEAKVQAALDRASENRTTIIVAHRLSTIRGANKIVVISDGKVVEQGTHEDLMELKKEYYTLVTTQVQGSEKFENIGETKEKKILDYAEDDDEDFAPKKEIDEEAEVDNYVKTASLWSIVKLNSPEWLSLVLGCIGAGAMGTAFPIFAILFGNILQVLQDIDSNPDYVRQETNKYCLYFVLAGVLSMCATFLQMYMFGRAGQKLTLRIRSRMFDALLKQEMGYFDRKENGVGSLCAKLSNEAAQATGQRIGTIVNSLATLSLSVFLAVYYEWRLGLVAMVFVPLIIVATFLQRRQMSQESDDYKESLQKSTKIAVEAVGSIRTVVSLGCEETFLNLYINELTPHIKKCLRNTHARAFILGFSRAIMIFAFSACLVYGGYLIKNDNVQYGDVFKVAQALIMGTVSIANSLAFTPNLEKGLVAARTVMNMINRIPKVSNSQNALIKKTADGNVDYSQIRFAYPTRDSIQVLKGLDLSVLQGKTVALVGPSGCGKSTIIQLLERFYDPASGTVSLDKDDIKSITLDSLRSHLGIVSQEPNLFSRSIAENIAYGDNSRQATEVEIIEAARKANIHNFIAHLPKGYKTKLGEKGTQLSGGQKQRIAIARALIRQPKVLLLDEATSALDAESEKVVQEALDNAKQGRTCLTIAHRLTTIQDADLICVVNDGVIVEQGNHTDLIERKGLYYRLHAHQH